MPFDCCSVRVYMRWKGKDFITTAVSVKTESTLHIWSHEQKKSPPHISDGHFCSDTGSPFLRLASLITHTLPKYLSAVLTVDLCVFELHCDLYVSRRARVWRHGPKLSKVCHRFPLPCHHSYLIMPCRSLRAPWWLMETQTCCALDIKQWASGGNLKLFCFYHIYHCALHTNSSLSLYDIFVICYLSL